MEKRFVIESKGPVAITGEILDPYTKKVGNYSVETRGKKNSRFYASILDAENEMDRVYSDLVKQREKGFVKGVEKQRIKILHIKKPTT